MSSITRRLPPLTPRRNGLLQQNNKKTRKSQNNDASTKDMYHLITLFISIIPKNILLLGGKDGLQKDMERILFSIKDERYSENLKKRAIILMKDLKKQKFFLNKLIEQKIHKETMLTLIESIYFEGVIKERQLLGSIIHELTIIQIARSFFDKVEQLKSRKQKLKGGGKNPILNLLYLLAGLLLLTLASSSPSSEVLSSSSTSPVTSFDVNSVINADNNQLQQLNFDSLQDNKKLLESMFGMTSEVTIDTDKFKDWLFPDGAIEILKIQIDKSLKEINAKYNEIRHDIIDQCKKSFESVSLVSPEIASATSLEQILAIDALKTDIEQLRSDGIELDMSTATKEISQTVVAGAVDLVSSFGQGFFAGTSGTKEVAITTAELATKNEEDTALLNKHIQTTAQNLVKGDATRFSIIAVKLFSEHLCSTFPTAKYTVTIVDKKIHVQFTYANPSTGDLINNLSLLGLKIDYLLKDEKISSENDKKLLGLYNEKVFQLLELANYGPFLSTPPGEEIYDAGVYVTYANNKYKEYYVKVLQLLEDYFTTKKHSQELTEAMQTLGTITRASRRAESNEYWENLAPLLEDIQRAGANVKDAATNVTKGAADVVGDTISHTVDKITGPFYKIAFMGATGIGLMVLFYCAVPLIKLYISQKSKEHKSSGYKTLPPPPPSKAPSHIKGPVVEQPDNGGGFDPNIHDQVHYDNYGTLIPRRNMLYDAYGKYIPKVSTDPGRLERTGQVVSGYNLRNKSLTAESLAAMNKQNKKGGKTKKRPISMKTKKRKTHKNPIQ